MSDIIDGAKHFAFDKNENKMFGVKSGILWRYSKEKNSCSPALYFSKPKHVSQEDFEEILSRLRVSFGVPK